MRINSRRLQPAILAAAAAAVLSLSAMAGESAVTAASTAAVESVGQMIVKFRSGKPADASLASVAARHGVTMSQLRRLGVGAHVYQLDRTLSMAEARKLAKALSGVAGVEYAEPDQILKADFVPNDPLYSTAPQWHYFEAAGGIDLPDAWKKSTGEDIIVADLDTGYRPHIDLAANIIPGYDFVSDAGMSHDGDGRDPDASDPGDWYKLFGIIPQNSSWHGTHTAGTIAAVTDNGVGVAGVAPNAKVMPVRVLGAGGGTISDISDAIIWSSGGTVDGIPKVDRRARVINMSLGGSGPCSEVLKQAIGFAYRHGTLTVVSAGNSSADASGQNPANCKSVIAVAATGRDGARASYSNFGSIVRLAAPGGSGDEYVWSTLNDGKHEPGADIYAGYQGTSMAAPHVSGVAALIYSINPSLTPKQVGRILVETARPFPAACDQCGSGIVDAAKAVLRTPTK